MNIDAERCWGCLYYIDGVIPKCSMRNISCDPFEYLACYVPFGAIATDDEEEPDEVDELDDWEDWDNYE